MHSAVHAVSSCRSVCYRRYCIEKAKLILKLAKDDDSTDSKLPALHILVKFHSEYGRRIHAIYEKFAIFVQYLVLSINSILLSRRPVKREKNKSSAVAEMGDHLATIGMGRKWGVAVVGGAGSPLGPHLTQCGLG